MSHIRNVPSPWNDFLDLNDTPTEYTGHTGKFLRVNSGPNGIEFTDDVVQKSGSTMTGFLTLHADPTQALHAATKQYVDSVAIGLDFKESVRVATTANITLSGEQTIDGVSAVAGDRVLVKNQSTASQNGLYVVSAGGWSRSADADSDAEVTAGLFVFVEEGTVNADTGWVLSTNDDIVVGTTALTFIQFSGAGTYTAGNGLVLSGSEFSADFEDADGNILGLGTADAGTSNKVARADHVHAHGNLAGGSLHSAVIAGGASGFMTGSDKTKLDGIATGAEVNQNAFSNIDVDGATAVLAADGKTDTLYVTGGTLITLTGTEGTDTLDIAVTGGSDGQVLLTSGTTPTWSTHSFLAMSDTPGTYNASSFAVVNAAGNALEFTAASPTQGDIVYFNGTSWAYLSAGTSTYVLTSNGPGANPSWQTNPTGVTTFLGLSDIDEADYVGHAGDVVRVNSTPDGLEFVNLTDALIDISGTHTGKLSAATTVADAMTVLDDLVTVPASGSAGSTLYYNSGWVESNVIFNDHANAEVGINTQTPNATLHVNGSFSAKIVTITANHDLGSGTNEDVHTILCNNTTGGITVTLPAVATSEGRVYHIKKISGASNDVVIDGNASETIDGATTVTLDIQNESVTLVCNGSAWYIV